MDRAVKQVILIEDDKEMSTLIGEYLQSYDYPMKAFEKPKEALEYLHAHGEDALIVILDLMLPQMDGFDVCKKIREMSDVPIIISSARGDIGNKIHGFEIGADDYLAKPYEPRELVLRIDALLRRGKSVQSIQKISDFEIDEASMSVRLEDFPIDLTRVEYQILLYLLRNRGKVLSREQIAGAAGLDYDAKERTVDMHISNIRQKIDDDAKHPKYIKSVWGIGYKFEG